MLYFQPALLVERHIHIGFLASFSGRVVDCCLKYEEGSTCNSILPVLVERPIHWLASSMFVLLASYGVFFIIRGSQNM